jgi:hypothetical protein
VTGDFKTPQLKAIDLGGLFVIIAQEFVGQSAYEMHSMTSQTRHALIGLAFVPGYVIGEPSLHVSARFVGHRKIKAPMVHCSPVNDRPF